MNTKWYRTDLLHREGPWEVWQEVRGGETQGPGFGGSQARTALLQEAKNLCLGHAPGLQRSKQAVSKSSGAYTEMQFPRLHPQ